LELRTMTDQKDPQRYVDKRKKKRHLANTDCAYARLKVLDGYQDRYSLRGLMLIDVKKKRNEQTEQAELLMRVHT
jgi:hypothetical protein